LREGPQALIIFFQNEKMGWKGKRFIRGRGRINSRGGRGEVDLLGFREFLSSGSCGKRIKHPGYNFRSPART
jgi:hypothetical protein